MSIKRAVSLTTLTWLLGALFVLPALRAADIPGDSKEVSDLLSQVKTEAIQLKTDAADMESFTLSPNLNWQSHAAKITEIKEHVNKAGDTLSKLNQARNTASDWQRTAIDRVDPILRELAANTTSIIDHLTKEQGRLLNTQEHKDYLKTNAELATKMAEVVSDFVTYGETKAKFEELSRKLEVAER
jgi:uncharacterized phage infection (PIP) family protein YhgE